MKLAPRMIERVTYRTNVVVGKETGFELGAVTRFLLQPFFATVVALLIGAVSAIGQTTPSTTGLKLWLAADTGVTLDGSGGVNGWADLFLGLE